MGGVVDAFANVFSFGLYGAAKGMAQGSTDAPPTPASTDPAATEEQAKETERKKRAAIAASNRLYATGPGGDKLTTGGKPTITGA